MDLIPSFTRLRQPEPFRALARKTRWHKRQGKIDPFEFLVPHLGKTSALRRSLDAQARTLTDPVSRQAIHGRYTTEAVDFFRASFEYVLAEALAIPPDFPMAAALGQHFQLVFLLDSSAFDVPASLKDTYPGCGGNASEANVKLLLRYEFVRGQFEPCCLLPGKTPDQGLATQVARCLKKGQWQIQDKGFFRQCKDTLRLDQFRSDNPDRVQCEVWAGLLVAEVAFLWHAAHADAASWATHRIQLSFEKVMLTLQLWGFSLARALSARGQRLLTELQELWRCLLLTARKGRQKSRTNSYDRLLAEWLAPKVA